MVINLLLECVVITVNSALHGIAMSKKLRQPQARNQGSREFSERGPIFKNMSNSFKTLSNTFFQGGC